MPERPVIPNRASLDGLAGAAGLIAILALSIWFASWTGRDAQTGTPAPSAAGDALRILLMNAPLAAVWLAAAFGLGWPLRRWLAPAPREGPPIAETPAIGDPAAIQMGLGIAAMLALDAALGAAGVLQLGGRGGAIALLAIGVALLSAQAWKHRHRALAFQAPPWPFWFAAPASAVLVVASVSAPGWLWASEFGGYDALSYHLQLPKEWLAFGSVQPLEHNVYSFLPGYVEAAYYHLMILRGDAIEAAYACQLLHAGFTLIAAWMIYRLASGFIGDARSPLAGALAAGLFLATPWVIVVGSLAYNEMAVIVMLAAGWLVVNEPALSGGRRGAAVGLLAGAACGAKLTALGFVAIPLGALLLMRVPARAWARAALTGATAGLLMLLPWLIRNYSAAGNPFFPFATSLFGLAHWTAEQAPTWGAGHVADASLADRLQALWREFLIYGMGAAPAAPAGGAEPWKAQWSALPWLGTLGLIWGFTAKGTRRASIEIAIVLVIQIIFWLSFTHLKSRFLLPAAVPLSIAAIMPVRALFAPRRAGEEGGASIAPRPMALLLALGLCVLSIQSVRVYRSERGGAPAAGMGIASTLSGATAQAGDATELAASLPTIAINRALGTGSRVLLIGEATPFYYDLDHIAYQTTWDRCPLSRAMRAHPDDPGAWAVELKRAGFTHVLVNEAMLDIWERSGWNDPLITAHRVRRFAESQGAPMWRYPGGVTIYRLR